MLFLSFFSTAPTNNPQHDDPAVLFSSSNKLTRYDKAQLLKMQELPMSQQKPPCFFEARVIQLSIMKVPGEEVANTNGGNGGADCDQVIEDRIKMLQQNLQTFSLQNWNSQIYQNLRTYQQSLLEPVRNYARHLPIGTPQQPQPHQFVPQPQQQQQPPQVIAPMPPMNHQQRRRVTFAASEAAKRQAINRILKYDRRTAFFDTLTTTTMMRPQMANFVPQQQQQQQQFRRNPFMPDNRRSSLDNSYLNQKQQSSNYGASMFAPGYFSANDGKPSSSNVRKEDKPLSNIFSAFAPTPEPNNDKDAEEQPEWFSFPATRHDFVELQGFDAEEEAALKAAQKKKVENNWENAKCFVPLQQQLSQSFEVGNSQQRFQQPDFNGHNHYYQRQNESDYLFNHGNPHQKFFKSNANVNQQSKFRNALHPNKPSEFIITRF